MTTPWANEVCEPEDAWDAYGNWETWVRRHLPEYAHEAWENLDEVLRSNLYSLWAASITNAARGEEERG